MSKRLFILQPLPHPSRGLAKRCIDESPDGYAVAVSEPKRKDIQNSKMHAMLEDLARQTTYAGRKWDAEDMKRIMVDEFADAMRKAGTPLHHDGRLIPSEDGRRVIQLGVQTRDFYVKEAAEFIEFLYSVGAEASVTWSAPAGLEEIYAALPPARKAKA